MRFGESDYIIVALNNIIITIFHYDHFFNKRKKIKKELIFIVLPDSSHINSRRFHTHMKDFVKISILKIKKKLRNKARAQWVRI